MHRQEQVEQFKNMGIVNIDKDEKGKLIVFFDFLDCPVYMNETYFNSMLDSNQDGIKHQN